MTRYMIVGLVGLLFLTTACAAVANAPNTAVKWSLLPDMNRGLAFASETRIPSVVADDWICLDGRPITDIHWWGAYWTPVLPGRYTEYSDSRPNPTFQDPNNPGVVSGWTIKIWADVPAGSGNPYSYPAGPSPLKTYQVTGAAANEVSYGATNAGRNVYQYYVDIANDPFLQTKDTIYWLSIEATLADPNVQWGWQESYEHRDDLFANDAAVRDYMGNGWLPLQNNQYDNDMAFELTTIPEPGSLTALGLGLVSMGGWMFRGRRVS